MCVGGGCGWAEVCFKASIAKKLYKAYIFIPPQKKRKEEIETFQVFAVQRLDNALHMVTWFARLTTLIFCIFVDSPGPRMLIMFASPLQISNL